MTTNIIRGDMLRSAGRIVGHYIIQETSVRLDDLARVASSTGKAFKGRGDLAQARAVSSRVLIELRQRGASGDDVSKVAEAFGMMGASATAADFRRFLEGARSSPLPSAPRI